MSKRKANEKEVEDVEMASDDSGSDNEGEDIINVDFEFFDPKEIDFHAVKNLLAQYFASDVILFQTSELSDMIIKQANVGTTIKVNGADSDPFSLMTVLNINHHLYDAKSEVMKQIKQYLESKAKPNEKLQTKLKQLLKEDSKQHIGLIISERFINMPVETAPPLWRMMREEINWAVEEGLPFNFEYYLLVAPTYQEVTPKIDLDEEPAKPTKKKSKTKEDPTTFFFHPEEELVQQFAEMIQDFKLTTPPSSAESKNTFEDYGIAPARRMMLIHKDKLPEIIELLNNAQW